MGAIDMFLINHESITKGFKEVLGIRDYLLVLDKKDSLICATYGTDACRKLAEEYLRRKGLDKTIVKFETKSLKRNNEQLIDILNHKLVLLDGEITTYKEVDKKAKEYIINGYDSKLPTKYRIDKYKTVSKI